MSSKLLKNAKQPDGNWSVDWQLNLQIDIGRRGKSVLSEELADLLSAIEQTSSISAAARQIGISYRHAWKLVQEGNNAADEPLVSAAVGGFNGGGAILTSKGKASLDVFNRLRGNLRETAAGLLHTAIGNTAETDAAVHLAAAISLQEVVGQLLTEYALRRPTVRVRTVYGASNELATHILAGAPCDLFLSADAIHFDKLIAAKRIRIKTRRIVAMNSLVAIGRQDSPAISAPEELSMVKRIVIADPASPLGRCTQTYLTKIGIHESISRKIVTVDNSRGVLAAIDSGRAEVGIAFASDAGKAASCRVMFMIESSDISATYSAAVCAGKRENEALALLDFFNTEPAQKCFRRCGLILPKGRQKRSS